jgi:hypothetical protein
MRNSIFILLLLFCACSPEARKHRNEQKLARLIKENPDLVRHDTTFVDTIVKSPDVHDHFEGQNTPDLWPVDSMTAHFKEKVDSTTLDSLNHGFKEILVHSGDMDTTLKSKNSKIHIKKHGKDLAVDVDVTPDPVKIKVPEAITNINPPPVLTWYENIFLQIGKTFGIIGFSLLLLLVLYILYRILKATLK